MKIPFIKSYMIKYSILSICMLVLLIILIMSPIFYKIIFNYYGDYGLHISFAVRMLNEKKIITPHFLYQLFLLFILWATPLSLSYSSFVSVLLFEIILGIIIFYQVRNYIDNWGLKTKVFHIF